MKLMTFDILYQRAPAYKLYQDLFRHTGGHSSPVKARKVHLAEVDAVGRVISDGCCATSSKLWTNHQVTEPSGSRPWLGGVALNTVLC